MLTINVNISSRQLVQPGFTQQVAEILAAAEVAPRCLKLEITENAFIYLSRRLRPPLTVTTR